MNTKPQDEKKEQKQEQKQPLRLEIKRVRVNSGISAGARRSDGDCGDAA
jgi:hypothetical protein